jgi:hypothetical protein
MNNMSFEDHERTLEEIKSLFFNTMYLWTIAFVSPLVISYHNFLFLFTPTNYMVSLVCSLCTWGTLHF